MDRPRAILPAPAGLVLIGYRTTGKTTVGRLIADRLGRSFFDADAELERRLGRTVAEVFATDGEPRFRDLEAATIRDLCREFPGAVLATGGGAVLRESTRSLLREFGQVAWLSAPVAAIVARLKEDDGGRPSLTSAGLLDEVEAVLADREPIYRATAHVAIDATGCPEAVAEAVLASLGGIGGRS